MNQNYLSTLPSSCPTQDADVQKLKRLLQQLLQSEQSPPDWQQKQSHYLHKISQMQRKILELSGRLAHLQNQHFETYKQLQNQKELRSRQQYQFEAKIKKAYEVNSQRDFWSTPDKSMPTTQNKKILTISPSVPEKQPKYIQYQRRQTLIDQLIQLQESKISTDQIHRLNSYLVQNTTAIKLLTQKCNYFIKLRNKNYPSLSQEQQFLGKTKEILSNRKIADEAKTVLYKSRKAYFQSDHSSSEIEVQSNELTAKDE